MRGCDLVVHLLMILHSALSAGTYLAAKRALFELSPFELALARFALAAAVYVALLVRRPVAVDRRDLPRLWLLGFVAVPVNQGFFLAGLSRSTPGHAALLYAMTPIFVFLLAHVRLGERARPAKILGIAIAFAGVLLVLFARGLVRIGSDGSTLLGDLLILGAVVAWAIYVVGGKPFAVKYGAVASTGISLLFGTILYLPIGLAMSHWGHFASLSALGWGSLGYLVIITSVLSYVIFYWALARAEASRVAIWSNLQPVMTALLAWGIYGEKLTGQFVAGGAMVLAGVLLTEW